MMLGINVKCFLIGALINSMQCQKPDDDTVSRKEFNELQSLLHDTRETVTTLELHIQDLLAERDSKHGHSASEHGHSAQKEDGFIGFTVYSTSDQSCNSNERVAFQGVITNYGSSFNTSTSEFVCPVNGYYSFSTTVVNVEEHRVSTDIMVGDTLIGHAYARNPQDCNQGASTGIIYCSQGTKVYVLCGGEDKTRGDSSTPYTSFSGVLLRITP